MIERLVRVAVVLVLGVGVTVGPAFGEEQGLTPGLHGGGLNTRLLVALVLGAPAGLVGLGWLGWLLFAVGALAGALIHQLVWVPDADLQPQIAAVLILTALALVPATLSYVIADRARARLAGRRSRQGPPSDRG